MASGSRGASSRRDLGSQKRTRITIPLVSKPRDYVPGSGPPLQPIQLLPPQDSTAYIVERVFLPPAGLAADNRPLPKRMTYIIGWHDLPAARLLVPAMQILEYVSPMALEEWEWELEQSLDAERQQLEGEEEQQAEAVSKKRKRQGPPAHSQIESAAVAEPEQAAQKRGRGRPRKGAMSLSTPQKTRLEDFEGLSDEEESPSRQIQREVLATAEFIGDSEEELETEGEEEEEKLVASSTVLPSRPFMAQIQETRQTFLVQSFGKKLGVSKENPNQASPSWTQQRKVDHTGMNRGALKTEPTMQKFGQSINRQEIKNGVGTSNKKATKATKAGVGWPRTIVETPVPLPHQFMNLFNRGSTASPASSVRKSTAKVPLLDG